MIKDLTNQRFGNLLVIKHDSFTIYRNATWECVCDCGKIVIVSSGNLKSGVTKSCGCLRGISNSMPCGQSAFNNLYLKYKSKAKSRKLVFELTEEQFRELTSNDCRYCGIKPNKIHKVNKRVGEYRYNGVDRIDSKIGYIYTNCVSCCYRCNVMKSDLSLDEFITHIKRIYENV